MLYTLAEKNIRVNSVHPTGVAMPMIHNEPFGRFLADHPSYTAYENLLSVGLVDPVDISEAMIYLCGAAGRYVTGVTLPVDAGIAFK